MGYSKLLGQDNGDGCIAFETNEKSFIQLNYSKQSFRVNEFGKYCKITDFKRFFEERKITSSKLHLRVIHDL